MKKTSEIIYAAALSALLVLSGCAKEQEEKQQQSVIPHASETSLYGSVEKKSSRKTTISVDRINEVADVLWEENDQILVNGSKYVATKVEGRSAEFALVDGETEVKEADTYDAWYPVGIKTEGGPVLPATQDYTADGSLAGVFPMHGTEIDGFDYAIEFKNLCGLLELTLKGSDTVSKIEVSDGNLAMCGAFTIGEDGEAVLTDHSAKTPVTLDCGEDGVALTAEGVHFYVAVPQGLYTSLDIKIYNTKNQVCDLPAFGDANVIRNEFYPLEFEPVFEDIFEFIDLGLPSGMLWANINMGASSPEDYGKFYAWGDTEGHKPIDGSFTHNFNWVNAPFNNGQSTCDSEYFKSIMGTVCPNNTLALDYDVAHIELGEGCRMPTKAEFQELVNNTIPTTTTNYKGTGVKGYIFTSKVDSNNSIFLPASGFVSGTAWTKNSCQYWSSTLPSAEVVSYATALTRGDEGFTYNSTPRMYGSTIRAVKKPDLLPGEFTINAEGKKVRFSVGNLQATYNGSGYTFDFAKHQYDYVGNAAGNTSIDSQSKGAVVDLFGWVGASSTFTSTPEIYGITTSKTIADYGNQENDTLKSDWGTAIDNKGTWYTLSRDEWMFLFGNSTKRNGRFKTGVSVCGNTKCVVIAPDVCLNDYVFDSGKTNYSESDWATAEAAGLVCLPAAGYREASSVSSAGEKGRYWTSSPRGGQSAHFIENGSPDNYARYYGYSVRLVTEVIPEE